MIINSESKVVLFFKIHNNSKCIKHIIKFKLCVCFISIPFDQLYCIFYLCICFQLYHFINNILLWTIHIIHGIRLMKTPFWLSHAPMLCTIISVISTYINYVVYQLSNLHQQLVISAILACQLISFPLKGQCHKKSVQTETVGS